MEFEPEISREDTKEPTSWAEADLYSGVGKVLFKHIGIEIQIPSRTCSGGTALRQISYRRAAGFRLARDQGRFTADERR
jgi:hypothetical protein